MVLKQWTKTKFAQHDFSSCAWHAHITRFSLTPRAPSAPAVGKCMTFRRFPEGPAGFYGIGCISSTELNQANTFCCCFCCCCFSFLLPMRNAWHSVSLSHTTFKNSAINTRVLVSHTGPGQADDECHIQLILPVRVRGYQVHTSPIPYSGSQSSETIMK